MKKETNEFNIRPVTWDDLQAVADLIYAVCEEEGDVAVAETPEEIEHGWREGDFNPETDAFVVETEDKQIVGYWEVFNENEHIQIELDGYIHPNYINSSVGEMLLKRAEERAQLHVPLAEPNSRVLMRSSMDMKEGNPQIVLHEQFGYVPVRYWWRMEIKLESEPTPQALADGIEFRPFIKNEHAQAIWMADNEAFEDHWGSHARKFEEWKFLKLEKPEFDPTLWLVAWDGNEIAGFSQNRYRNNIGWVGTLGVRRAWRNKGLGLALLTHSFAEFYKRDTKAIGLGVDASNPTGATRLYQKAGMSIANQYVTFEKELRAGKTEHNQQVTG